VYRPQLNVPITEK